MAVSRVVRASGMGLSASVASQPLHWSSKKDLQVTTAAPQHLKQTQSSLRRTQLHEQSSTPAGRHTSWARAAMWHDTYGSSDPELEVVDSTQKADEAAQQADILVNIEPDHAATLFCSSDSLTRQEVIELLKKEYGRGVLKGGGYNLPPTSAVLPPGTYTFTRSANQGPASPVAAIGAVMDGINAKKLGWGSYTPRTATCARILAFLVVSGPLLIRAPPVSGKTSTLQLLANHVSQGLSPDFDQWCYVSLGNVGKTDYGRKITFDEVWRADNKGVEFEELWETCNETEAVGKRTLLLVDDGEAAFDQPLPLFSYIKLAQSGGREMRTKIILVSSLRSNQVGTGGKFAEPPGSWNDANTIGLWPNPKSELPSLQFTPQEADELWDAWMRVNGWQDYKASSIKEWILRTTERHPGTLSRVFERIQYMDLTPGRKTEPEWRDSITEYLLSPDYAKSLNSLRNL